LESTPKKEQSTESVSPNLINQSSPEASIAGAATSTSQLSKAPESITSQLSKAPESITSANLIEDQQSGPPLSYFLKKSAVITPNKTTTPLANSIDRPTLPPEEFESVEFAESWNFQESKAMAATTTAATKQEIYEDNSLVATDGEHDTDNDFDEQRQQQQQRDWDEAWRNRILKTIRKAKKQRQIDVSLIEQKKQELAQQKRLIDRAQYDLEIRESRLVESEPLIPSVKKLRSCGITFDLIFPYIETLNEKAVLENIDLKTAAYNLILELRDYRQLRSMNRAIEVAKLQLAAIDMFALNRQQALSTLVSLQQIGITEREIIELIDIVHRWNNYNQHPGLNQGNGSSNSGSRSMLDDGLINSGH